MEGNCIKRVEDESMKRINYFFLAALALVAAVSCDKTEIPVAEELSPNEGVPMTLTATIGGPDTRMSLTEDGNVLKATWDASEKISVITYTGSGYSAKVQTIDNFTYSGAAGQKSVDFAGTFTGDAANNIWVVYPALEYDSAEGDYRALSGILRGVKKESDDGDYHIFVDYWAGKYTQTANGDPSFLNGNLLTGAGTVKGSALSVDLEPAFGVLKLTLTMPEAAAGKKVYGVYLTATGGSIFRSTGGSSFAVIGNLSYGSWSKTGQIALNGTEGIEVPSDRKLVCYVPFEPYSGVAFGEDGITSLKVVVSTFLSSSSSPAYSGAYTATKTLSASPAIPAEEGKMYRLSLDF